MRLGIWCRSWWGWRTEREYNEAAEGRERGVGKMTGVCVAAMEQMVKKKKEEEEDGGGEVSVLGLQVFCFVRAAV